MIENIRKYASDLSERMMKSDFASLEKVAQCLLAAKKAGRTVYLAGNGGSAADSDHITGELTKSFLFKRPVGKEVTSKLAEIYGTTAEEVDRITTETAKRVFATP